MTAALRLGALMAIIFAAAIAGATPAAAQSTGAPLSGFIVGVETDTNGALTRFAVSDSSGTVHEFAVSNDTQFGLENQAGDRWVSTFAESPVEAAERLRDHRQRLATVTVTSANGTAVSVVERESGRLETNLGYLFAVFAVTWAGFMAYMFWVSRKQRELQKELARLRASLSRTAGNTE